VKKKIFSPENVTKKFLNPESMGKKILPQLMAFIFLFFLLVLYKMSKNKS